MSSCHERYNVKHSIAPLQWFMYLDVDHLTMGYNSFLCSLNHNLVCQLLENIFQCCTLQTCKNIKCIVLLIIWL